MSYKPDEGTLVSYLYDELETEPRAKVEKYLLEHPEERARMRQLGDTLGIIRKLDDKEVIAPSFLLEDPKIKPFWNSTVFRTMMSIAASFILILIAARLLQTEVSYQQGELRITFGERPPVGQIQPAQTAGLSEEQVKSLIHQAVAESNLEAEARWNTNQKKIDQAVKKTLAEQSGRFDDLMRQTAQASEEQIRGFVASWQTQNLQAMKDYLQLSSNEQRAYVEGMLVDFSKYLQEQRNQDLQMFQQRFTSIEQNTNVFKQETEQILANIISNGNGSKKNNY